MTDFLTDHGKFTLTEGGSWTYTLDNASASVQALAGGEVTVDSVLVSSVDGSSKQVSITITGLNDAPVADNVSASGTEDQAGTVEVILTGSDIDNSDAVTSFKITSIPNPSGTLYRDAAGTIVLNLNDVVSASGETAKVYYKPAANFNGDANFTYSASDGDANSSGATATISIASVNDAPIAKDVSASGNEDTTISIQLSGSDVDGAVQSFKLNTTPFNGKLFTQAVGGTEITTASTILAGSNVATIFFRPNADYNGSASFGYIAVDFEGKSSDALGTASITVNPVADAAIFGTDDKGDLQEDITVSDSGNLTVTDPDSFADSSFVVVNSKAGTYGTFSITDAGAWSYTLNNGTNGVAGPVQSLSQGQEVHDFFTVTSKDGTTHQMDMKILGTNDAPTANAVSGSATKIHRLRSP